MLVTMIEFQAHAVSIVYASATMFVLFHLEHKDYTSRRKVPNIDKSAHEACEILMTP